MTDNQRPSGADLTDALTRAAELAAKQLAAAIFPSLRRRGARPMSTPPWSDPAADPFRDLAEARQLLAAGAPPTYGDSTAAAGLYLTGEGRDVAQALGVPVHVSHVLNYGDVLEDRTTGELRLIVGTANPPSDHDLTLAAVRRDARRIVHYGLRAYGDPQHHRRELKAVDLEEAFDRIRRPAVAAALKLDPRHAPRRRGYVEGSGVRIDF